MPRKILLIDDDRLQYRLTQALLSQSRPPFELDWADNYDDGLKRLMDGQYAACLLDYQLGTRDGLELIREAVGAGCRTPIIFLTAESGESVDTQAMNAGALDYLVKGEINARALDRSLRYALKLADTLEALRRLATHDELTGLLNRREFERILTEEEDRARRFGRPLAMVLLDVDFFKNVNDTRGHAAGDEVLHEVAQRIARGLRSVDRVARYGGEEFAVMVAEANAAMAHEVAQRLVEAVRKEPVKLSDGTELPVTISAGSAEMRGASMRASLLVQIADKALYLAKAAGRNRAMPATAITAA
ncbi:hypothetical protein DB347_22160 [Opitutaceae bacterium EW11]|nr:hypothetical protein DB347_22160 [Opitutaceae bacterium EW11]